MKQGLSAILRLKNEEQFITPCIESIIDWFDEIIVCLQNSTDATEFIVKSFNSDKIKVFHYEYDSWPNGPGYNLQDETSIYSRTYFYNWCLAKVETSHACKWDGDMVAMDFLGGRIRKLLREGIDFIKFHGTDIVDDRYIGRRPYNPYDGVFKVSQSTRFVNGLYSEKMLGIKSQCEIREPAFLHFKWSKDFNVASQAWPDNWRDIEHFRNIYNRSKPVAEYTGEWPECLIQTI